MKKQALQPIKAHLVEELSAPVFALRKNSVMHYRECVERIIHSVPVLKKMKIVRRIFLKFVVVTAKPIVAIVSEDKLNNRRKLMVSVQNIK